MSSLLISIISASEANSLLLLNKTQINLKAVVLSSYYNALKIIFEVPFTRKSANYTYDPATKLRHSNNSAQTQILNSQAVEISW